MESKVLFIYTGKRLDGNRILNEYRIIAEENQNDGRSGENLRTFNSEKPLWKGAIGMIYPCTLVDEKSVSYNSKTLPIGIWKNQEDKVKWRLEESPANNFEALKKEGYVNDLDKWLEPLREVYRSQNTRNKKEAILAKIIEIVTR